MEASSHDAAVAYAAAIDLSDQHGRGCYRTLDFGEHWQTIVQGLAPDVPTRVVREDPEQPNLLYAGTQTGAWVSFDRGDHWQPLQLNLPTVAVNDITVHENDLVIATWGRALWILDDVTPLRQIDEARASTASAFLWHAGAAMRVRWNDNQDTPVPPEVPTGQNPPDGAILDYYLREAVTGPMTMSIPDAQGRLVRSTRAPRRRRTRRCRTSRCTGSHQPTRSGCRSVAGMHRVVWDLRYPTPPSLNYGADGQPATRRRTASSRRRSSGSRRVNSRSARWRCRARITCGYGRRQASPRELAVVERSALSRLARGSRSVTRMAADPGVRDHVQPRRDRATARAATAAAERHTGVRRTPPWSPQSRRSIAPRWARLPPRRRASAHAASGRARVRRHEPTPSVIATLGESCARVAEALTRYRQVAGPDLAQVNAALGEARVQALPAPGGVVGTGCGR